MMAGMNRSVRFFVVFLSLLVMSGTAGCGPALPATTGVASETIDVMRDPEQVPAVSADPITRVAPDGRFTLTPVAQYRVSAVVVSRHEYHTGWNAELSPIDLALAWGELTEPRNLNLVHFRQSNRWYYYRYGAEVPFGNAFIGSHSSNHHIIPASDNVARAVKSLRKGDTVTLEGYLVNVDGQYKNGSVWWRSSLSRTDTGDGACEVMLVNRVQMGQYLYE